MIGDRHLHTRFSEDSNEDPENCIRKAISLNMEDIWFTDHYDIDFPGGGFSFDADRYFKELYELKEKYSDKISVHIGVELGLKKDINDKIQALINKYPFEYRIGSVHLMDDKDPYEREKFDMTDREFYRRYFETALDCLENCTGFDTFGHIDYVVRYGYEKDRAYSYSENADIIDEILKHLIKNNIALEVNTAGLRKGLKYVHPYPEILKRYRELGGENIVMGSDAHKAEDIGADFDRTLLYLHDFGFNHI